MQDLLREVGDANVSANAGGGMTLEGHRAKVNASGDAWNTSLSGQAWDVIVLQDQSQVPGFPRTQSDWVDSKDAAIALTERIDDEGADVMLLMTWGRRSGDSMNTVRYPNFTAMNDHLLQGYLDYANNATSAHPAASVYVAPVGLAFAKIHDDLLAAGTDPDQSGTLFHDLYTSDGSHPSLHGSYLAAATSMPPSMVAPPSVSLCQAASTPAQVRPCSWRPRTRCSTRPRRGLPMDGKRFRCVPSAVVGVTFSLCSATTCSRT